jgi:hypothetical protein
LKEFQGILNNIES